MQILWSSMQAGRAARYHTDRWPSVEACCLPCLYPGDGQNQQDLLSTSKTKRCDHTRRWSLDSAAGVRSRRSVEEDGAHRPKLQWAAGTKVSGPPGRVGGRCAP